MAKKKKFNSRAEKDKKKDDMKPMNKNNPFEIHINRSKHEVIGRKRKEDRGLPGVSRSKALKKREKTLLQEYKSRHKSNVFVDRRIGENDPTLDPEKKIALRLAAVKIKQSNRKNLFNLNDDDVLTHGGKALDDDTMDDRMAFSDEEDDQILDAQFVKERHFGGGFLTKREDGDEKTKSKKEWIDEIIAESKKKKADARKEKEEQYSAVTELDKNLQHFMQIMSGKTLTDEDKLEAKKTCEFRDYDMLVKELGFDRTGKAKTSSRLKSPEEIIKEEKEKLLALEADRVRRMQGITEVEQKSKSADDLDDGFYFKEDNRFYLSYKDGKILKEDNSDDSANEEADNEDADSANEEAEDVENADSANEEADDVGDADADDATENDDGKTDDTDEEDSIGDDDEEEGGDDMEDESDQYSDIFEESDDENEDEGNNKMPKKTKSTKTEDLIKKKDVMEAARKEMPYTFEVPQDYEAFWALLENRSPKEVNTILERMIACNHPGLGANNKEKTERLATYILQTLNVLTEEDGDTPTSGVPSMSYIDSLIPHLYAITQTCSSEVAQAFRQVLEEKFEDCTKFKFRRYPMADCFVFLKTAGVLFPSSDYIHPVMTPVITFLINLLGQAKVNDRRDIVAALFTSYLLYEYLSVSKRFVPELMNLLNGLLFLSVDKERKVNKLPLNPPFKRGAASSDLLVLERTVQETTISKLTLAEMNDKGKEVNDSFKVNVLCKIVKLIGLLCNIWSQLPSIKALMEPTAKLLESVHLENYPECARKMVEELKGTIDTLPVPTKALVKQEKKPKPIKMYEPAIEKVIDGIKNQKESRDKREQQKLMHKLTRERKAAKRELTRDASFLAGEKLKQTLESDRERKRKVKEILGGLQNLEGEHNKWQRIKKRR